MSLFLRRFAPVLFVACAALFLTGCSSNNKGKIVGKWKSTNLPDTAGKDKETLKLAEEVALIFEFTEGGKMTGTASITMFGQTQTKQVMSADYSLGSGDWVFFSNIQSDKSGLKKSRDKIVINGDTMTIDTEKGEKLTFARMK